MGLRLDNDMGIDAEATKEKFKPVWALMDKNSDGVLDFKEICLITQGNEAAAEGMMSQFGETKDGKVTFDQYMDLLLKTIPSDEHADQVVAGMTAALSGGPQTFGGPRSGD